LIVKIGQTVESYSRGIFRENSSLAPLGWNFESFDAFNLFPLLRWIDWCIICENQLNGSKVIQEVIFFKFPDCSPKMEYGKFLGFLVFPLAALNPLVYCKREAVERVKSYSTGCCLKSPFGAFSPKKWPLARYLKISLKFFNFFRQGAPIELIWAKITWMVEKLLMVLFKLEIPITSPNLGGFGVNEPLGSFLEALRPQKALLCARSRRLTYRLSKSTEQFFLGAVTRNGTKF
jgi:hypothetical protein